MGRMNPVPSEAAGGSNAFAVADQHIKAAIADRVGRARAITEKEQRSAERWQMALEWVGRRPGLCVDGRPCDWAVWGLMELRKSRPQLRGDGLAGAVQEFRRVRFARLVRDGLLSENEAAGMLAGRYVEELL
jgi:hypothetical protein